MVKQRFIWADSLKGWLMLLVILGHAIQSTLGANCGSNHVWNLIYSFHMPAFMAISGWLTFRERGGHNGIYYSCKRRNTQLLLPYFVWTVISFLCKGEYTLRFLGDSLLYPDRSFWFLWVLFWICIIFNLAQLAAFKLGTNEMWFVIGTCLILFGVMVVMEIRILGFQFLAYYFLFYTFGYCLHKYEHKKALQMLKPSTSLTVLTILWAFLAWGWTMHGLPSWMPTIQHVPTSLLQYAYRGLTAVVAIMVLIGVAPTLLNGTGKLNRAICNFGVVSLGLYVVHLSLMSHIVNGIQNIAPTISTWGCIATAFVVALFTSYSIVWLLNKNKYTARIFLGKI
ncbi:MAG: acyltransferase family protein [Clostridium sp.]|nr:acyltransferase family protein [Clostridium sp.]